MLGGNVLVAQLVGLFSGEVDDALDARRDEHLAGTAAVDGGPGADAQHLVEAGTDGTAVHVELRQQLRDGAVFLLQQGQQDMLGIDLVLAVALQDFVGAGGGILRAFRKAFKAHHGWISDIDERTALMMLSSSHQHKHTLPGARTAFTFC